MTRRERSQPSKGLFWKWRKEEPSVLGAAQKWKEHRDSGVSRGHGAGLLCCISDRRTGILSLATGHWGSPALKAKYAVSGGRPWRKTTNELNSVETRHAGGPAPSSSFHQSWKSHHERESFRKSAFSSKREGCMAQNLMGMRTFCGFSIVPLT